MRRKYRKPPIVEAICEFSFELGQPWDGTLPGLIYSEVKESFPKKRQQAVFQFGIQIAGQNPAAAPLFGLPAATQEPFSRLQFLSEDERTLIQIAPDVLTINKLRPYSSWSDLKPLVLDVLAKYQKAAQPKAIRRLGVRYINRIQIPLAEVQIQDYLVAFPNLPEALPQRISVWMQRSEIPFDELGTLILQTGSVREPGHEGVVFLLDLDFVTSGQPFGVELAADRIETAHEKVELAFETCITQESRKLFEEIH
jgi:uncharacterized protein (TIGR04255 family)